jgi:hypothetical protein
MKAKEPKDAIGIRLLLVLVSIPKAFVPEVTNSDLADLLQTKAILRLKLPLI